MARKPTGIDGESMKVYGMKMASRWAAEQAKLEELLLVDVVWVVGVVVQAARQIGQSTLGELASVSFVH